VIRRGVDRRENRSPVLRFFFASGRVVRRLKQQLFAQFSAIRLLRRATAAGSLTLRPSRRASLQDQVLERAECIECEH